jgi:hypothetical protein
MEARWISALAAGRAMFLDVTLSFVRICVLPPEDGIKFSLPSPCSGGVSSTVGGRVEMCLRRIYLSWICSDLFVARLRLCVFRLSSDLRYPSSATVAVSDALVLCGLSTTTS